MALLGGCVRQYSYVSSSFEPVTVEKKSDLALTGAVRPFNFYNFCTSYALTNNVAARAGVGGFEGLAIYNASAIYFRNYSKLGWFTALEYSYQLNQYKYSISKLLFFQDNKNYNFDCRYHSPAVIFGVTFVKSQSLIFKFSYNAVNRYNYYYERDNGSGSDYNWMRLDEETLNYKIPNFLSFEPSYASVMKVRGCSSIKVQLSFSFCQKVARDNYIFLKDRDPNGHNYVQNVNYHPVCSRVNLSLAYIFSKNVGKKK